MSVFPLLHFVVSFGQKLLVKTQPHDGQPHEGVHFPTTSVPYTKAGRVPSINFLLTIVGLAASLLSKSKLWYPQTSSYSFCWPLALLPTVLSIPKCPTTSSWPRGTYGHVSPRGSDETTQLTSGCILQPYPGRAWLWSSVPPATPDQQRISFSRFLPAIKCS